MHLFVWLYFVALLSPCFTQEFYIATPNTIRLGADESLGIAVDGTRAMQIVDVYIYDFPGKKKAIFQTAHTITPDKPEVIPIRIEPSDLPALTFSNPKIVNYVSLVVKSGSFDKEIKIPISSKSGYVFVQTDKPIYTPAKRVSIRIIPLTEDARPSDNKFRLQIKNPKNVVVEETIFNKNGNPVQGTKFFVTHVYQFPTYPLFGEWSAIVSYGYQFEQNSTVSFELQEYVLPTFTVKLKTQEVILPTTTVIRASVEAKYVYGRDVEGIVTFRFGVKGVMPEALYFGGVASKNLVDGKYKVQVNTSELKQHKDIGWFPQIEGSHFVVEATVRDAASGNTEFATDAKGRFSTSPFLISFERCLEDFKPGLISVIEADVSFVDGKPAAGISTSITAVADGNVPLKIANPTSTSDAEGRVSFEIHPEMNHNTITVTVTTNDAKYEGSQASKSHTQLKFVSNNKAYIAITRRSGKTLLPATMFAEVIHIEPADISDIYYLVVSKGKIMKMAKLPRGRFKIHRVEFMMTYDMVPSFRLVVFANYKNELIADSIKIDLANECNPKADVKLDLDFKLREPGKGGKIIIRGSKSTLVGLLAVDEAIYALSKKDLLTKAKMFNTFKTHDLGCGPGGGLTSSKVLGKAGVVIMTNTYTLPDQTVVSACEENVRRKREIIGAKLENYKGRQRYCCALGMNEDRYGRLCKDRAEIVKKYLQESDQGCSEAFHACCVHKETEHITGLKLSGLAKNQLGRIGGAVSELEFVPNEKFDEYEKQLSVRSDFRETWFFEDIPIGLDNEEEFGTSLPHSITTWVIQAVAVSRENGMCVTDPQRIESFKKVFLQLNLPYSVVRNEQIEIQATLFNYGDTTLAVNMYMYGVKDLCTQANDGEKSEIKKLVVQPVSAQTVVFPVIPLKAGVFDIKVTALSLEGGDIIIRPLNVVSEGRVVEEDITFMLDPSNQQKRQKKDVTNENLSDSIDETQNLQVTAIKLNAPDGFIPDTESCVISALGDQFGPTVETSLQDPDSLILKPHGCGEQNMIYLAPTLYTMRYLKVTAQITPEKEAKGYEFIRHGYGNQLTFRKPDGSFGAWIHTASSVWLTAFVMKVFCQASHMVHIEENIMCSGIQWLVNKQQPDGSFMDDHPIYHRDMMGGVNGQSPMTAFVLITLQECNCDIQNLHINKARAVAYLEEHLGDVVEPLPVAIVAYALGLSDSDFKRAANDKLLALGIYNGNSNTLNWGTGNSASDVETTSYGLLTQLLYNDLVRGNSIVNWLNTKRLASGSFPSTQDTVMALQALSEYAIRARAPALNLVSNITSSNDRNFHSTLNFHEQNALVLQEVKMNKLGGMLFVNTGGHGVGIMSVKLRYNVNFPPDKLCRFHINVSVTEELEDDSFDDRVYDLGNKDTFIFLPEDKIRGVKDELNAEPDEDAQFDINPRNRPQSVSRIGRPSRVKRQDDVENSSQILKVHICTRYLGNQDTGMSIVDAGLFSGYKPNEKDLKNLLNSPVHLIQRYEPSSRGVVFYLEKIPVQNTYCFSFRITRDFIVGETQASVIKVYDYYNPDETCIKFYSPDSNSPLLRKICSNGICQCLEGGCPPKNPFSEVRKLPRKEMKSKLMRLACEHNDFVWIGKSQGPTEKKDGFLNINFLVEDVIKAGKEKAGIIEGTVRLLLARDSCDNAALFPDREYMIMGKDGEKHEDSKGNILPRYLLDRTSSIYLWNENPSRTNHLARALIKMSSELKANGCNM